MGWACWPENCGLELVEEGLLGPSQGLSPKASFLVRVFHLSWGDKWKLAQEGL